MVPAIRRKSRKKGGRKSERRGCWQQAYNTVFHQTVMLLCWLFPSSCFYCQCMYQATPNKHNQSQPTRPIPSSFPPFLSGGDYWLDLKDFLFPKTSTESISSPGRRFWLYQGPETPNPPSCCWETTPVICVLSECITDGDVRARERERERRRDERGTLAGERGRKRWRRKYTIRTSTPAPFFFHALSPYKHTLHCGARLTCFDSPSSLSVFSLPQFQLLGLKEWGMCLAAKLLGENIWCLIDRGWSKRLVICNYPKSWDCVCVHVSVSVCERDLLPGVVCECS